MRSPGGGPRCRGSPGPGTRDHDATSPPRLNANFLDGVQAGAISGSIRDFKDAKGRTREGWLISLKTTAPAGDASGSAETGSAEGAGSWEGVFHGGGRTDYVLPDGVTGRFDLHLPGAYVAGAFGAGR